MATPSKGHIASIGAGMYSDMSVAHPVAALTSAQFAALDTQAEFDALFTTEVVSTGAGTSGGFVRIKNVREFPAMGTPPNVVKVPVYGFATSQQIQGQSDAPSMELKLNYIGEDWAKGGSNVLGNMVGDGLQHVFRFALLNSKPTGAFPTQYASAQPGLGTVENSYFYWIGKIEAMQVTPQLTDANQATVTITIQSDFFGAWTAPAAP